MSFHNVRFPTNIGFGATVLPKFSTDIVTLSSGYERRNSYWGTPRLQFDVSSGVKSKDDVFSIYEFFMARAGRAYAFRFKNPFDFKSCDPQDTLADSDQSLGTGDGSTTAFQVQKHYISGGQQLSKNITRLVSGTLVIAIDDVATTAFTVNIETGIVTFTTAPANNAVLTCGYEFDVPVRFREDSLGVNALQFSAGSIPAIPLIEVRE